MYSMWWYDCFNNLDLNDYLNTILCFIIWFLLLKCVFDRRRQDRFTKVAAQLPGPYVLPIFGNNLNFFFPGPDGLVGLQRKYYRKYGPIYRVWLGNQLWIGLSEPENLKEIFNSKASAKSRIFEPHCTFFGEGLSFVLSGNQWRSDRKRIQPFFKKDVVSSFLHKMNKSIGRTEKIIGEHFQNSESDITPLFGYLCLDFIVGTQFNYEMDWDKEKAFRFTQDIDRAMTILRYQVFLPFLQTRFFNYLIYKIWLSRMKKRIEDVIRMFTKDFLVRYEKAKDTHQQIPNEFSSSFLSRTYHLSQQANDEGFVVQDAIGVVVPALLTMMKHMSYFTFMIALYPEVQDKIFEEICQVLGASERKIGLNDISRFTYLDQVIKECHRTFVFSTVLWKELERDTRIEKCIFPAGTGIMINVANVHQNPQFYPAPNVFNPDNFKPAAVEKRPQYSFIPFGAGSRSCIGLNFADLSIKLTLVTLLRRYTFHTSTKVQDIKFDRGFTTRNFDDYRIQFKPRNLTQSAMH